MRTYRLTTLGEAGFTHIVGTLRKHGAIDAVYDLTLTYTSTVPQTETAVFTGFPSELHVHIHRYPIAALPADEELGGWLRQQWVAKEQRLEAAAHSKSIGPSAPHATLHPAHEVHAREWLHLAFWLAAISGIGYLFLTTRAMFYYTLAAWAFLQAATLWRNGIDAWERARVAHAD